MPSWRCCDATQTGGLSEETTRPAMRISPPSGASNPATHLRSVVLPEPLAPTMTKNSPSATSRSSPLRAATLPPLTVNSLARWRIEIIGSSILHARHRIGHRLLEGLGPAPLLRRPALAFPSDLIHGGVKLYIETVGVDEFPPRVASGAAPPLVDDLYPLGAEKVPNLEQLRDAGNLEGAVMKAGLALFGQLR